MLESRSYRNIGYAITDEPPLGAGDQQYIVFSCPHGWYVYGVADRGVVSLLNATEPHESLDEAVADVQARIDADILELQADRPAFRFDPEIVEHRLRRAAAAGDFTIHSPVQFAQVQMELDLVIRLHNALPPDAPQRGEIQAHLRAAAGKMGCVAGLVLDERGDLRYLASRASENVQRRKAERKTVDLLDRLQRLGEELHAVYGHQAEAARLAAPLPAGMTPLSELAAPSHAVARLTALNAPVLQALSLVAHAGFEGQELDKQLALVRRAGLAVASPQEDAGASIANGGMEPAQ